MAAFTELGMNGTAVAAMLVAGVSHAVLVTTGAFPLPLLEEESNVFRSTGLGFFFDLGLYSLDLVFASPRFPGAPYE